MTRALSAAVAALALLVEAPAPAQLVLKAGTPVPLAVTADISTGSHRQGDRFDLTVTADVLADGAVAVARGTRAVGAIAEHAARGSFGRAGTLEIELLYIDVGGRQIRIDGRSATAGKDAALPGIAAGVIVGGLLGSAIKGKDASLPAGATLTGYIHRDVTLAPVAPPPPSAN